MLTLEEIRLNKQKIKYLLISVNRKGMDSVLSYLETSGFYEVPSSFCNHSIFRLDIHRNLTYLCAVTFKNNDYGKRKSKLPGGI